MSNHWLRLWHDMPNDPKWRTITRISGQPISLVQATYLHLLVDASRNVTRGHATVTLEDLASALDVTEDAIQSILDAMQGRVLDDMYLLGWEKRQPKREDAGNEQTGAKSPAERKREQRAREKEASDTALNHDLSRDVTQCHDASRDVTTDKEEIRGDISKPDGLDIVCAESAQAISPAKPTKRKSAKSASRATAMPDGFTPNQSHERLAVESRLNLQAEFEQFCDYHRGKGSTFADWDAALRTWLRNAVRFKPTARGQPVETFRERDERLARERVAAFAPGVAAKPPVIETGLVIDAEPVLRRIGA